MCDVIIGGKRKMMMKMAVVMAVVSILLFASALHNFVQGDNVNVKRGVAEIFGTLLAGVVASVLMQQ